MTHCSKVSDVEDTAKATRECRDADGSEESLCAVKSGAAACRQFFMPMIPPTVTAQMHKLPHIKFEDKIIYVLGCDNKDKWQNVLGAQFGCVYIDEINTANIDFVREISTRNDYLLATLNPDDPALPVYKEFVNRSRPFKKYENDVPAEIMSELTEEPVSGRMVSPGQDDNT